MNKELEQAAKRIARYFAHKFDAGETSWLIQDRVHMVKQRILTDPYILELVKDRERLNKMFSDDENLHNKIQVKIYCRTNWDWKFILTREQFDSAIEQGEKEKV